MKSLRLIESLLIQNMPFHTHLKHSVNSIIILTEMSVKGEQFFMWQYFFLFSQFDSPNTVLFFMWVIR